MFNFRKISRRNPLFIQIKKDNYEFLEEYKAFLEDETMQAGKSRDGKSGKADSYVAYLIFLYLISDETGATKYELDSYGFYSRLKVIRQDNQFNAYNNDEARFPSATISSFQRFWNDKQLLNDNSYQDSTAIYYKQSSDIKLSIIGETVQYFRDHDIRQKALSSANWKCEISEAHRSFTSKNTGENYVESHHLIPIGHQGGFDIALDTPENIVALCPNCHKQIHHAVDEEKRDLIHVLYLKRIELLRSLGIEISLEEIYLIYNIDL